jgi:ribosomal protein S18 acetylase RimI-like enzyme
MEVLELKEEESEELVAFQNREYPEIDKVHFGDNLPDFNRKEFVFIVRFQNQIAGYLKMSIDMGVGRIWSILVGGEFRRKRVATTLCEYAEDKAKKIGVHKMKTETGSTWEVKPFFERMGYTVRAILPNDIGHIECVLMDKFLK